MSIKDTEAMSDLYTLITEATKSKPDYLDVDGDGDTKEPMKKALKDKEKTGKCSDCGCTIGKPKPGCKCKKDDKVRESFSIQQSPEDKSLFMQMCEEILKEGKMCNAAKKGCKCNGCKHCKANQKK